MKKWYMLTLVGKDRPGIVAHVTAALFDGGCNLGESTMVRLGDDFTIMMMVEAEGGARALEQLVAPVAESMGLHLHVDPIDGRLHRHLESDVQIVVYGADRPGIVARVTGALAEAGLNIVNLDTDVAGSDEAPLYVLRIDGVATEGVEALRSALETVTRDGIEATLTPIETMIG